MYRYGMLYYVLLRYGMLGTTVRYITLAITVKYGRGVHRL